jgi:hypothetical protein
MPPRAAALLAVLIVLVMLPGGAPARALAVDDISAVGLNDLRSDGILLPDAEYDGAPDLNLMSSAPGGFNFNNTAEA